MYEKFIFSNNLRNASHHTMLRSTLQKVAFCLLAMTLTTACITEDVQPDTHRGNFEALWQTLDEHYCFFDLKKEEYGLDWSEVYSHYAPRINDKMTERQLFDLLTEVICELRDGHVNLSSIYGTARYGAWFDNYPVNYSDSLERIYLGRSEEHLTTGGLSYRLLSDNIGYISCPTFQNNFGDGNLHELMRYFALADGLIIDIRNNGGGQLTAAEKLASLFVNDPTLSGYMRHKTGAGHSDFSSLETITLEPFQGLRWQKPVCILTNRRTYSAANSFVAYLKGLPNVCIVGDVTGGGGGLPLSLELPNGWALRFSACPMYDRNMQPIEQGISPDIKQDINSADYARGIDTIIEEARKYLKQNITY